MIKKVKGQIYLGEGDFISRVKELVKDKETLKEIPKEQRYITKPSLKEIIKDNSRKEKDRTVYESHVIYGYTLKDIAEYLSLHYATVSRMVKRAEEES